MPNGSARGIPPALLEQLQRPGPLIILPHDNPDPDALASAAALQYIAEHLAEKDAVIALGGIVGRAENRAMLRYLNINLAPVSQLSLDAPDALIALVDTQPGRRNNSLPDSITPAIVIDHHPAYTKREGIAFADLREEYGATSTMLTEYMMDARVVLESKIATALFYGIMAETQDLGREASDADTRACHFLYPFTNKRRLAKIENVRVPREYFRAFHDAVERAIVQGRLVLTILDDVGYPDMVAEVADFLLRLDEAEWSAVLGHYRGALHVSLRTTLRDVNAGEILQKVLGSDHAGGHDMIAGGRVDVGTDPQARALTVARIRERLIDAIQVADAPARGLV